MGSVKTGFGIGVGLLILLFVIVVGGGIVCATCVTVATNWPVSAVNSNNNAAPQIEIVQPRSSKRKTGLP